MKLSSATDITIVQIGHWTSLTYLTYIHLQIKALSQGVAWKMSTAFIPDMIIGKVNTVNVVQFMMEVVIDMENLSIRIPILWRKKHGTPIMTRSNKTFKQSNATLKWQ